MTGAASMAGTATRRLQLALSMVGTASVSGTATRRIQPSSTMTGTAFASATARLVIVQEMETGVVFGADSTSTSVSSKKLPSASRMFSERITELRPQEATAIGFAGDPAVSNKLRALGVANLETVPGYSGAAYTFEGPPDPGASPIQLGFRKGDKIRLRGPVGGEPNDAREVTLLNPATKAILEPLILPDTTEYEFTVLRRGQ